MTRRPVLFFILALLSACASRTTSAVPDRYEDVAEYRAARERLIQQERARRLGADMVLSVAEEAANRRLLALKQRELDRTRAYFPPAHSFLSNKTKTLIEESPVLRVMQRLPKGGILHAHGSAMGDFRWLVSRVTYRPDCYIYVSDAPGIPEGSLRLSDKPPGDGWRLVSELRAAAADQKAFDEDIYRSITLGEDDLDSSDIWEQFSHAFRRTGGLLGNPSVYAEYWRNMLARLIDENVQYLESRTNPIDEAIVQEARQRDAAFDVKFIPPAGRADSRERIAQQLNAVVARPRATIPIASSGSTW